MKVLATYAYDGNFFEGSQTQPNGRAVEDAFKLALSRVGIFEPNLLSASRTDTGVHATAQRSTFIAPDFWDLERLKNQLNRHLKPHIFIKNLAVTQSEFQVRFDARSRSYRYILRHDDFNPFASGYCYFTPHIDLERLNLALSVFIGEHDFGEFSKMSDVKSTVRQIYLSRAYSCRNLTVINFRANGFLRSQVRLMVANAILAAKSVENLERFLALNDGKFRLGTLNKMPISPCGLYLSRVGYYSPLKA